MDSARLVIAFGALVVIIIVLLVLVSVAVLRRK